MKTQRLGTFTLYLGLTCLVFWLVYPRLGFGQEEIRLPKNDRCIACHVELDFLPEGFIQHDVHLQMGLSCAGCHGGDPTSDDEEQAMSAEAGFVGTPSRMELAKFCGKCHSNIEFMRQYQPRIPTDQETQYSTSIHGKRLMDGDKKVASCTDCHTAHGILHIDDARSSVYSLNVPSTCNKCHGDPEYMEEYKIPTNQYEGYAKSVHGKALLERQDTGAPACNDCHGNHGAMPPGITSVRQVCGHCHVNNLRYFSATKMSTAFQKQELHGCEECHYYHDIQEAFDDMVGTGETSVCVRCHYPADKGYDAAKEIHKLLVDAVSVFDRASEQQKQVGRKGMDDVEIGFLLQEANQSLIQARTLVHTFDPIEVGPRTREAMDKANEALELGIQQVKEYRDRRRGFSVITIFITLIAAALFFKIRDMETT
jgi:hypothetical protein